MVRLTVQHSSRRVDVELPTVVPIGELVPAMLDAVLPSTDAEAAKQVAWAVGLPGREPFSSSATLTDLEVREGSVVQLERHGEWPAATSPWVPIAGDGRQPRERTTSSLPPSAGTFARVGTALAAAVARRPEPPEGNGETRRGTQMPPALFTVPIEGTIATRLRRSWRSTSYRYRLDRVIQEPQLKRCVTIAVVSPKGGVGKTTISALLGGIFALLRRDRIVAVDTNPDFGSLGRSLTPGHEVYVDDLLEVLDDPQLTVTALDANLGRGLHGLMVLPAPTDPARMQLLDQAAYTRVVRRLQNLVGMVILDCGTGLHDPASRAALETADQVVLVTDADPATASLVAEAAVFLRQEQVPIWLTVNRMPTGGSRLRVSALEAHIPFARGLVIVPAQQRASELVAAGTFDWREAPVSWQRALRELAAVLAAAWPELGVC